MKKDTIGEFVKTDLKQFPKKYPILYNNEKIGNIVVNFELPQKIAGRKSITNSFDILTKPLEILLIEFFYHLEIELPLFVEKLQFEFELINKFWHEMRNIEKTVLSSSPFDLILSTYFFEDPEKEMSTLNRFLFFYEDEIFNLIKSEGPKVLANQAVQMIIKNWIKAKDTASIGKLSEELKKLSDEKEGMPRKVGRPTKELTKEGVRKVYYYILTRLQLMKKHKDWNYLDSWESKRLIDKKKKSKDDKSKEIIDWWLYLKDYNFTWRYEIHADENLREDFNKFEWRPSHMTIKVIAKLFDTSDQKIKDILFPRKK
jgi:hypothetical protein